MVTGNGIAHFLVFKNRVDIGENGSQCVIAGLGTPCINVSLDCRILRSKAGVGTVSSHLAPQIGFLEDFNEIGEIAVILHCSLQIVCNCFTSARVVGSRVLFAPEVIT